MDPESGFWGTAVDGVQAEMWQKKEKKRGQIWTRDRLGYLFGREGQVKEGRGVNREGKGACAKEGREG